MNMFVSLPSLFCSTKLKPRHISQQCTFHYSKPEKGLLKNPEVLKMGLAKMSSYIKSELSKLLQSSLESSRTHFRLPVPLGLTLCCQWFSEVATLHFLDN